MVGLTTEREVLYQRINQRVDLMMDQGLIEEAKAVCIIQKRKPLRDRLQGIFIFKGRPHWRRPLSKSSKNSRRYAKRQLTWFNNRAQPRWIDLVRQPEEQRTLETEIDQWLEEKDEPRTCGFLSEYKRTIFILIRQ